MNRTALQNYFSIDSLTKLVIQTEQDIKRFGIDIIIEDQILFDGILYRLEVIGEVAKNVSKELTDEFKNINWRAIARTRDLLAHHYHKIDKEIIRKIL